MVNKVHLIGRLGKDPERKHTQAGKEFSTFSLATSKKIKDEEITQWHNVVVWSEHNAKYVNDYAQKGTLLYVEGEIEYRSYEKDGITRYATDIVVGAFNGNCRILQGGVDSDGGDRQRGGGSTRKARQDYGEQSGRGPGARREEQKKDYGDLDDEIPF